MTTRVTTKILTFRRPFQLDEVEQELPAGIYEVETKDETIDGVSFQAHRRLSTRLILRTAVGDSRRRQHWVIDPDGLAIALERDEAAA